MPNDLLKEALTECASPLVMVVLSKGEVASRRTELRAFTDGTYTTVSNVPKLYSMVDGSELALVKDTASREIANDEFDSLNELVTMKSSESDQIIGVDSDLAFSIAGEEVFCPLTGKEKATLSYIDNAEKAVDGEDGDAVKIIETEEVTEEEIDGIDDTSLSSDDDDSDNESEDDDSDDDDDDFSVDDEDEEDSEDDESVLDLASFSAKARKILPKTAIRVAVYESAEAVDPVVDGNVVNVVSDDTYVVADDTGSNFTVKATDVSDGESAVKLVGKASSVESATVKVTIAETTNPEVSAVRLINLSGEGNSEIAVFVGGSHIGTLHRSKASEKASELFSNGTALFQAFKPTLLKHYAEQASAELAKFGYVANTLEVQVGDLFQRRLQREVAAANNKAEVAASEKVNDMAANFELAFMGLNKGLLKGENDLVVAIASELRRAGVVKPERRARELLARNSKNYIRSALEHAKVYSTKSSEYLNGLTVTLANADFVVSETEENPANVVSTALLTPEKTEDTPQVEVSGFNSQKEKPANRYTHLFQNLVR